MTGRKRVLWIIGATLMMVALCIGAVLGFGLLREQQLEKIQAAALMELDAKAGEYEESSIVLAKTSKAEAEKLAALFGAELRITENGEYAALTLPEGTTIRDIYENDDYKKYIEEMSADYHVSIADGRQGHYEDRHHRRPQRPDRTVTDTEYELQTYFDYINMESVWSKATGKNVTVAVLDTGIDTDHPEFAGRISEYSYNASEDKIVKDYLTEEGEYDWSLIEDEQGHGTSVAGVIAASMNSGSVVGVSPNVNLIVIKAESDENGVYRRTSDLVFGIYYAIERGANVLNMSFGDDDEALESEFEDALQLAYDSDMICVASAGNDGSSALFYPAANENVIGVGALDSNSWDLADYSNYGENTEITAPGTVYTSLKGGVYGLASGTSYSAPVVTGAIALLMQSDRYMTVDEVRTLLHASAYDLGDLGPDNYFGYGSLDVSALVTEKRATVTFDMLTEELENTEQLFISGHTLLDIPEPERLYAVFDGWYYDDTFTQEYSYYEDVLKSDTTLYAKWVNEDDGIPFTYVTLDDGTVEIRSYTGRRRYITVPGMIDGKVVSTIGANAFSGQSRLREVTLPDSIRTIGENAFSGCSNLTYIDIPENTTSLDEGAFSGCSRLEVVNFLGNPKLTTIHDFAFENCGRLEYIKIPAKTSTVIGSAFYGATALKTIDVTLGNSTYVSKDGVLFSKSLRTIVAYPVAHGANYALPEATRVIGSCAFAYSRLGTIDLTGVTEIGASAFNNSELGYINIADSVTQMGTGVFAGSRLSSVSIGAGITEIPEKAFYKCANLLQISIGENVLKIGKSAFLENTSLSKVEFAANSNLVSIGQGAFAVNKRLAEITFPATLVEIGTSAFEDNYALQKVAFEEGSNLKKIGDKAFAKNYALATLELPSKLETIGETAFSLSSLTAVTIPATVTDLGAGAFMGGSELTAITVEKGNRKYHDVDGVVYNLDNTEIYAYPSGKGATTYDLPDTVKVIKPYAFGIAKNLRTITLHEGLEEIGESAFSECSSLNVLNVPDSVVQIGRYAFKQTTSLSRINFGESSKLPRISYAAFAYSSVSSLTIPANVSTVAQYAFYGCDNLTSVTFAKNSKLDHIPAYLFDGCKNLTAITFMEGSQLSAVQAHGLEGMDKLKSIDFSNTKLTEIDNFSFRFCEALTNVTLPEGTLNIGRYAFYGCKSLAEFSVPSTVEHIGPFAFLGTADAQIYFKSESLPLFLDENWDYGIAGYYLGVKSVHTSGDFQYAVTTTDNIAILDYTGTATILDLTAYDFGGDITIIGGGAFKESTLTEIVLPETLTTIQAEAFGYSQLVKIDIPASVTFIGKYAFAETPVTAVNIPAASKLAVIEQYAFTKTESLGAVTLPKSITTLGTGVFCESGLRAVTFADGISLAEIPEKAFAETKLTSVKIPDSVTLVNHSAFNNVQTLNSVTFGAGEDLRLMSNAFYHTGLDSLYIPENVTYIGEYCFVAVSDLTEFEVSEKNPNYSALNGLLVSKTGRKLIAAPAGLTGTLDVPAEIEEIGFGAFEESKLSEINFAPNANILSLGYRAFFKANNITEIKIPASVVSLDYYAFAYCENLETVTFAEGNQLKGIYEGAFCGAAKLKEIAIPDSIVEISDFAFYGCKSLTALPISETAALKGIYDYAFAYSGITGEMILPETLIDIGSYAFLGTKLNAVSIPDVNKKDLLIDRGAFEECDQLEEITVPFIGNADDSYLAYIFGAGSPDDGNQFVPESLKTVTIANGVTEIPSKAFYGLEHLETINVPHSVTTIYAGAFAGTSAQYELTNKIYVSGSTSGTFGTGLSGHLEIVSGSSTGFGSAFKDCTNLKSVKLPDTVVNLYETFSGCTSLEKVEVSEQVSNINRAFQNCTSLKHVTIGTGVTTIGGYDFENCNSLKEIHIPANVTEIYVSGQNYSAFKKCAALERITVDENNTQYCSVDGVLYNKNVTTIIQVPLNLQSDDFIFPSTITDISWALENNTGIKKLTIPNTVKNITGVFNNCSGIEEIVIEDGTGEADLYMMSYANCPNLRKLDLGNRVYYLGGFSNCQLEELVISDSVKSINITSAFKNNPKLEKVTVGNGITKIPYGAFANCPALKEVVLGDNVSFIESGAFDGTENIEHITIGANLSGISNVFRNCTKLKEVYNNSALEIYPGSTSYGYVAYHAKVVVDRNGNKIYKDGVTDYTEIKTDDGFVFIKDADGYTLIDYIGGLDTVTLPAEIEGSSYSIYRLTGVKNVIIPEEFTEINANAFENCSTLESIVLPKGITKIGYSAFNECRSLKKVSLNEGLLSIDNYAFQYCEKLSDIVLPDTLEVIYTNAFTGCSSLKSLVIPESVKSIFSYAFSESGLTEFSVTHPLTLGNNLFSGCKDLVSVTLPETVTFQFPGNYSISSTFSGCEKLEKVVLPQNLMDISQNAFYGCTSLKSIEIPESVTVIQMYAFDSCTALKEIVIPDSVTTVNSGAFEDCTGLEKITIGTGVTSINTTAFARCSALKEVVVAENNNSFKTINGIIYDNPATQVIYVPLNIQGTVTIPEGVTKIADGVFTDRAGLTGLNLPSTLEYLGTMKNCTGLTEVVVPDGVTSIGDFTGCINLESITIPGSVTKIGSFEKCRKLKTITIPDGVTQVGSFAYCDSLESIVIPDSVTNGGYSPSFRECISLKTVVLGDGLTTLRSSGFYGCVQLESVTLGSGFETMENNVFFGCEKLHTVVLQEGFTAVGDFAFFMCTSLKQIDLPDSIVAIGSNAFAYSALTALELPDSLETIGDSAFEQTPLEEVVWNDRLVSIGANAFDSVPIRSVELPATFTTLSSTGFNNCAEMESLTVAEENEYFCAIDSVLYNKEKTEFIFSPRNAHGSHAIPETITSIPASAFSNRRYSSITLPSGLAAIGDSAFANMSLLAKIVIPDSVKTIGNYAFSGSSITELTLGASVETIGTKAFNCSSLETVYNNSDIPLTLGSDAYGYAAYYAKTLVDKEGNKTYTDDAGNYTFFETADGLRFREENGSYALIAYVGEEDTVTLPLEINGQPYTVNKFHGFKHLIIPEGITEIGDYAFYGASTLESVILPSTLKLIGDYAFGNATRLKNVQFPDGLESIGAYAFYYCSGLTELWFPDSLKTIGESAFRSCRVADIYMGNGLESIGSFAFLFGSSVTTRVHVEDFMTCYEIPLLLDASSDRQLLIDGELVTSITVPEEFTVVDDTFAHYRYLESVVLHDGITSIEGGAFQNCIALRSIDIPDSVTTIGSSAFSNCEALTELKIPESVTSIGAYAFSNTGIKSMTIPEGVTVLSDALFSGSDLEELHLHNGIRKIGANTITPLHADEKNWENGLLIIDGYLFAVDKEVEYFDIPEDGFNEIAHDAFANCPRLKMAVYGSYGLSTSYSSMPNLETLFITGINSNTPVLPKNDTIEKNWPNLKNIVITDDVDPSDLRYCEELFKGNDVTGLTIYVESNRDDLRWDDNFPNWHNKNRVIYGDDWSWTKFYDTEGTLITYAPRLSSEVIRLPAEEMPGTEHYNDVVVGWDTDGDGIADNIPATSVVDIVAYPVTERVAKTYTVTFADADGTVYHSAVMSYGDVIAVPEAPAKLGHQFDAWDGYTDGITVSGDMTFTAQWIHDGNGHIYGEPVTVAPTCTERGYDRYTCSICGEYADRNYVDALGHDDTVTTVAPSCTDGGYDQHYCGRCDTEWADNLTDPVGHSYGDWIIDIQPECEKTGTRHRICSVCEAREDGIAEATGHDYTESVISEATCQRAGRIMFTCNDCGDVSYESISKTSHNYQRRTVAAWFVNLLAVVDSDLVYTVNGSTGSYYACSDCGEVLSSQAYGEGVIIQDGCQHPSTVWSVYSEAGCLTEGIESNTCSACSQVVGLRVYSEPLGHDPVNHEAKEPNCTEVGWDAYEACSRCDYTTYVEKAALGHDPIQHEAKEPECEAVGWDAYETCSRCDHTTYAEKAALGHDLIHHEAKEPACGVVGWNAYDTCSRCDHTTYEEKVALDHDLVYHEGKEPDCLNIGWDAYETCSRCDYTTYVEKAALGHDWSEWIETKAPTETEVGEERRECNRCDVYETRALKDLITVESGYARAGEEMTVEVHMAQGHDITEATLVVDYDAAIMELITIEYGDAFILDGFEDDAQNGEIRGALTGDGETGGKIATLLFTMKTDAAVGEYDIEVGVEDITDQTGAAVAVKPVASTVEVVEYKTGDIDSDGTVNTADVILLMQYINRWQVTVNEYAVDVSRDGRISIFDAVYLLQLVANQILL